VSELVVHLHSSERRAHHYVVLRDAQRHPDARVECPGELAPSTAFQGLQIELEMRVRNKVSSSGSSMEIIEKA